MPSKQPRTTQAELQQRVNEVLQIRLQGGEFHDLLQHASEQKWNVSERQLWNYIAKADALLAETLETDRTKLINRHVAQRRALFARCMSVSDYSNARAVLKDEAELLDLYPTPIDSLAREVEDLKKALAVLEKDNADARNHQKGSGEDPGTAPAAADAGGGAACPPSG